MAFATMSPRAVRALRMPVTHLPRARSYATKPTNPTSQFYKTFTRPVAKVLLVAVFTYQVAYWSWVKLETDEVRSERDAEIAKLEATVKAYDKANPKAEIQAGGKS